jgi:hypothetical protein
MRTRPLALPLTITAFDTQGDTQPPPVDNVQIVDVAVQTSDTVPGSTTEGDNAGLAAGNLDYTSTSEDTFPPAVREHGNPLPQLRVIPPSPIVTPKTEDETLVPGTVPTHTHARQRLPTTDKHECMRECDRRQS